jgi:hypothetical protein
MTRITSKVWYLVAGGMILPGISLAVTAFMLLSSTIGDMHRVVMPGKTELMLPAGRTTLYAERRSSVDGKAYSQPEEQSFRCGVTDAAGNDMGLASAASNVSYSIGDYAGRSAFDLQLGQPGTYVLACEAPGPFVIAIGQGAGAWIVVAALGGLTTFGGMILFLVVLLLRRGQKRRAAAEALPRATAAGGP